MKLRNFWVAALIGITAIVAHSQSADHNPVLALQAPTTTRSRSEK